MRWDDDADPGRQNRMSPWEIEPTGSVTGTTGLSASGSKRTKICQPPASPNFPVPSMSSTALLLVVVLKSICLCITIGCRAKIYLPRFLDIGSIESLLFI